MPIYSYEAADRLGKKVRETMEAADESAVLARLKELELTPLSVRLEQKKGASAIKGLPAFKRVTTKDLLTFTQELASLLESGLPVDRAIYVLSVHSEKEPLRLVLEDVYKDIQRGQALSQAMSKHPKVFPKLYVNMVRAGEVGGFLDQVVKRLAAFLETTVAFQEELVTALVYPVLLTLVGGLAVTFILMFVVPRFAVIFQDMGQNIPLPTLVLMNVSSALTSYWWLMLIAAAGLGTLARQYLETEKGTRMMDGLKLNTPVVRDLHMKTLIARFSRTLGTLLQSGVPILDAITVTREVVGNTIVSERLVHLEEGVRKGRGVSTPLRESGVFPSIVLQMVSVGEEAGRLEQTFLAIAQRFESESASSIKRVMGLVGPMLILLMAVVVGLIVISMLLAVFSINEVPI